MRQLLAVRAGDKRYTSTAARPPAAPARQGARSAASRSPTPTPTRSRRRRAELCRVRRGPDPQRMDDARAAAGIRRGSPEQVALAAGVRRRLAWPEIVGLVPPRRPSCSCCCGEGRRGPPLPRQVTGWGVAGLGAVDARGLAGDRWYAVVDADGRLAPEGHRAGSVDATRSSPTPRHTARRCRRHRWRRCLVRGRPCPRRGPLGGLRGRGGRRPRGGDPASDGGQVSLVGTASLAWCRAELGVDTDPRRLRVNLVVETTEPFEEESWVGSSVSIGSLGLAVAERIERCRTVDLAQDGVATTPRCSRRSARHATSAWASTPTS